MLHPLTDRQFGSRRRPVLGVVARSVLASLACVALSSCEPVRDHETVASFEEDAFGDRLAPGDYRGAVTNASHRLSLDTLDCDVDTASVTVRLPDGDAVFLEVKGMSESEDEVWEIRGIEGRTGDDYIIRIRK